MKRISIRDAYIVLVVASGTAIFGLGIRHFTSENLSRFISCTLMALVFSGLKLPLPSIKGTLSLNSVFFIVGIAQFSLAETLILGFLATLTQCIFQAKSRPKLVQVLFSIACVQFSLQISYSSYHFHHLQSLILATSVFFVANTLTIATVIGLSENQNALKIWKASHLWTFPSYFAGTAAAWLMIEGSRFVGWEAVLLIVPVLYLVFRSHKLYVDRLEDAKVRAEQQRAHAEKVAALHRRTIETLALAIEAKDQTTHEHLQRVEVYAIEVGKELGLGGTDLEALRAAALLHDIGKIAVPEYIIAKPGKLTPEEFDRMKTHTVVGAEMVERIDFPYPVAPLVRGHHERWNGTGYPDGLAGEKIPMGARILAAVDCLDALASDRQYRRALPLEEAMKIIEAESGKSFDPNIVHVLVKRYVQLELMARTACQIPKLSTDFKIERGDAPAVGFEKTLELVPQAAKVFSPEGAKLASAISKCSERQELYRVLETSLIDVVPYSAMVVYVRQGDRLMPACLGGENCAPFAALDVAVGTGLSGWVAEHGKSIINGNPLVEPAYLKDPARFNTLRSALAVPLVANGRTIGVFSLYRRERDAFIAANFDAVNDIAEVLAKALESTFVAQPHQMVA